MNTQKQKKQPNASKILIHSTEWIYQFWAWQLLIWTLYRYFLKLPERADELIFKPIIFVLPVLWYVARRERRPFATIGLTWKRFLYSIALGFGIGAIFIFEGIAANRMKYGSLVLRPTLDLSFYSIFFFLLITFATAFSEELLCRGFYVSRFFEQTKRIWSSIIIPTALFMAFHVPILVTSLHFRGMTLVIFFLTTCIIGITNSVLFLATRSIVAPILVHIMWNITVFLYI